MGYTELFVADARLEMDMRIGEQKISILYRDAFTKALLHLFFLFDLFELLGEPVGGGTLARGCKIIAPIMA